MFSFKKPYKITLIDIKVLEESGGIAQRKASCIKFIKMKYPFEVDTLEGKMKGRKNDFLVKGNFGELYVIRDHIFKRNYEVLKS